MAISISSFTRQLSIYAIVLFTLHMLFSWLMPAKYVADIHWAFVPFFYLVTLASKYLLYLTSGKRARGFSSSLLSINISRFALYLFILIFYAFSFPGKAIVFTLTFFAFYFAFSLFEVRFMYKDLK